MLRCLVIRWGMLGKLEFDFYFWGIHRFHHKEEIHHKNLKFTTNFPKLTTTQQPTPQSKHTCFNIEIFE
jgi:hypothetical protein